MELLQQQLCDLWKIPKGNDAHSKKMANIVDVNIFKPFHNHTKRVVMSKKGNAINYRLACECGKRSLNVVRKAVMITALASTKKWSRHIVVMMLADTAIGLQRQRCATMTRHIRFTYVCWYTRICV